MKSVPAEATRHDVAAWILAGVALFSVLHLRLLPALLAGLLVAELVHVIVPRLRIFRISGPRGRLVAVALLAVVISSLITVGIIALVAFFRSDAGSLSTLLAKMADIVDAARDKLPVWIGDKLPDDAESLRVAFTDWLRTHADTIQVAGATLGITLTQILVGLVIGALVALREVQTSRSPGPLAAAMAARIIAFGEAFRRIVFAQVRISALNTTLTAVYLMVVLPSLGVHLPLRKTMIAVTFFIGLMPIIGNLISNTVIVIVSLSHSLGVALGSLGYLILIHKLEYFINARIVGTQIHSKAWELLIAMLVMEAAFGIPGVIAAPIYYGYIKYELAKRRLL
ncbi:MAG: AI-2E family transporter [Betaproteobacteria bacterium]|nr:AI-2E family transporter [Betaproteobacteria bacterium]